MLYDERCARCCADPITAAVTDPLLEIPAFLRRPYGDRQKGLTGPRSAMVQAPERLEASLLEERAQSRKAYEPACRRLYPLTAQDKFAIEQLRRYLPDSAEATKERLAAFKAKHAGQRYDRKRKVWVDIDRKPGVPKSDRTPIDPTSLKPGFSNFFE